MTRIVRNLLAFALLAILATACAPGLHAQNTWVYVNDNNGTANGNSVSTLTRAGVVIGPAAPNFTLGTGIANSITLRQQALYNFSAANSCLFVADPSPSLGFPNGDITSYVVTNATGALSPPLRAATPFAANGFAAGIGLIAGGRFLFGAYSGTHNIVAWKIAATVNSCVLVPAFVHAAAGASGGYVQDMALSTRMNPQHLVVTYGDGSVQSFRILAGALAPDCAAPTKSAGFLVHGSLPFGVDVTANGLFAVFGDKSSLTELETIPVPIVCGGTTLDFGGPAPIGSGISLGAGVDSLNVWISPAQVLVYVSNNLSGRVTTATFNPVGGNVTGIAVGCAVGFTNPTILRASTWIFPAGIGTALPAGNGSLIYVAEWGSPSTVALLQVSATGCTREVPASPFPDINSNATTGFFGLTTLTTLPPRPF
jgi:hypothetical protein